MAFETGSAANMADLINVRLKSFLVASGWTLNADTWPTHLALSYGACFANFRFDSSTSTSINSVFQGTMNATDPFGFARTDMRLWSHLSSGYSGSPGWNTQPNSPVNGTSAGEPFVLTNDLVGPFPSYYIFGNNSGDALGYCYVVVETRAGHFVHLCFGEVDQGGLGYSPNAAFMVGTFYFWWPNSTNFASRNDVRWTSSNHALPFSLTSSSRNRQYHIYGGGALPGEQVRPTTSGNEPGVFLFSQDSQSALPNPPTSEWGTVSDTSNSGQWATNSIFRGQISVSNVTPLISIPILVENVSNNNVIHYLGDAVDIRMCSMMGLSPGQQLTFGNDTWFAFPVRRQSPRGILLEAETPAPPEVVGTSFQWGMAYKQVL